MKLVSISFAVAYTLFPARSARDGTFARRARHAINEGKYAAYLDVKSNARYHLKRFNHVWIPSTLTRKFESIGVNVGYRGWPYAIIGSP